jgi:hypothetical protein
MVQATETAAAACASQRAARIPEIVIAVVAHLAAPPPASWQYECTPFWLSATAALANARLVCRQWAAAGFAAAWQRASTKQLARIEPAELRAAAAARVEHLRVDADEDDDDGGGGDVAGAFVAGARFPRLRELYFNNGGDKTAKRMALFDLLGRCGRAGHHMGDSYVDPDDETRDGSDDTRYARLLTSAPSSGASSSLTSLTLGLWNFNEPAGIMGTLLLEIARLPKLEYLRIYPILNRDVIERTYAAAIAAAAASAASASPGDHCSYSDVTAGSFTSASDDGQAHPFFPRLRELHANVTAVAVPPLLLLVAPPGRSPSLTRLALTINDEDGQAASQQRSSRRLVLPLISGNFALQRHLLSLHIGFGGSGGCTRLAAGDLAGLRRLSRLIRLFVGAWCASCCGEDDAPDDDSDGGDNDDPGRGEGVRAARAFTTDSLTQLLTHLGPRLQRLSFLVRFPGFSPLTTLGVIGRLCPRLEELMLLGKFSLLSLAPSPVEPSAEGANDDEQARNGGASSGKGEADDPEPTSSRHLHFPKLRWLYLTGLYRTPSPGEGIEPGSVNDTGVSGGDDAKSAAKR